MAVEIRIGCSGFQKTQAEYFSRFRLVEIQQTFYKPPQIKTAERWRQAAPTNFVFTLKAWQLITHEPWSPTYRRTGLSIPRSEWGDYGSFRLTLPIQAAWERTRDIALVLDAQVVLFQCPRQFTPTPEHIASMRSFFEKVDRRGLKFAWEPRGEWPDEQVAALCAELDLIHAVDPFTQVQQSKGLVYYRMHGGPDYQYQYIDTDLERLKSLCVDKARVYCLFNNVSMWDDASRFQELILRSGDPLILA